MVKKLLGSYKGKLFCSVFVSVLIVVMSLAYSPLAPKSLQTVLRLGFEGGDAYAGTPDYWVDGTDDDVQVRTAINALPATGGKIILYGGNWDFHDNVTRAIGNITIEGSGKSTSITTEGTQPPFICTGQTGWTFTNFSCDETPTYDKTNGVTSGTIIDGIWIGGVYTVDFPTPETHVRTATLVVAANDSSLADKAGADAVCAGTDDDVVINAAATVARALWVDHGESGAYPTLHFAPGKYNITASCNLMGLSVVMDGTISVPTTYHGIAVEVGRLETIWAGTNLYGTYLKLNVARVNSTDAVAGDIGIVIYNAAYCTIEIPQCNMFYQNVVCDGHGKGFANNRLYLGHITDALNYGLVFTDHNHTFATGGDKAGWVNENKVFGGWYAGTLAGICVNSETTAPDTPNNNVFYSPNFEGVNTYGIDFLYGRECHVLDARLEGPTYIAHFGAATHRNVVEMGYGDYDNPVPYLDESTKRNNIVTYRALDYPLVLVASLDFSRAFVDSAGETRVPSAELRNSGDSVSYDALPVNHIVPREYTNTAFVNGVGGTYIRLGPTAGQEACAIGTMIDTRSVKQFLVRPQYVDKTVNSGCLVIIAYADNGTQYAEDSKVFFEGATYSAAYGGCYLQSASVFSKLITLHTDVKSAFIGVSTASAVTDLVGLNIFVPSAVDPDSDSCRTWLKYTGVKQPFPLRYSAAAPIQGGHNCLLWEVGDQVWHEDAVSGEPVGWQVVFTFRDSLDATEAGGQTILSVHLTTGVVNSDIVGIMLDTGIMHWTHVDDHVDDDTITVHTALPSGAAENNAVVFFRFNAMANLA